MAQAADTCGLHRRGNNLPEVQMSRTITFDERETMKEGFIATVREDKGFGYIASPGQRDVFFHCSSLVDIEFDQRLLNRRVEFSVQASERGPRAINIRAAN